MKTKLTPKDVTSELIDNVAEYLVLRAKAETIRQEVDKVHRGILENDIVLMSEERGDPDGNRFRPKERILDPSRSWLGQDEQMPLYYKLCDEKTRAAELKPDDMPFDHCPALVAEHDQRKAEWALIEEAAKMLGVEKPEDFNGELLCSSDGLERRQKFIDLVVGLVLSLDR